MLRGLATQRYSASPDCQNRFRVGPLRNKNGVKLDPHTALLLAIGPAIGWVMVQAGVFKQMLERRDDDRVCPSCGRNSRACTCA